MTTWASEEAKKESPGSEALNEWLKQAIGETESPAFRVVWVSRVHSFVACVEGWVWGLCSFFTKLFGNLMVRLLTM